MVLIQGQWNALKFKGSMVSGLLYLRQLNMLFPIHVLFFIIRHLFGVSLKISLCLGLEHYCLCFPITWANSVDSSRLTRSGVLSVSSAMSDRNQSPG